MVPLKSESSVKKFKVVVDQLHRKSIGFDEESLQNDNNQNNEEEYQMLSEGIKRTNTQPAHSYQLLNDDLDFETVKHQD